MSNNRLEKLVLEAGWCCLYYFMKLMQPKAKRGVAAGPGSQKGSTVSMAARMDVSPRTIKYARAKFDSGVLKCTDCEGCLEKRLRAGGAKAKPEGSSL